MVNKFHYWGSIFGLTCISIGISLHCKFSLIEGSFLGFGATFFYSNAFFMIKELIDD